MSNRVASIITLVDKHRWFYVSGLVNPADLGTGSLTSSKFLSSDCWTRGLTFLYNSEQFESTFCPSNDILEVKEDRQTCFVVNNDHPVLALLVRRSSLFKCISALAIVLKYIRILKDRCCNKKLVQIEPLSFKVSICLIS